MATQTSRSGLFVLAAGLVLATACGTASPADVRQPPDTVPPTDTVPPPDTTSTPPTLASLALAEGEGQGAWPGRALANDLVVRALDQNGQPFKGLVVAWSVAEGGGQLDRDTSVTAADGTARARWTLGGTSVTQSVHAVGGPFEVDFSAHMGPVGTWRAVATLVHPVRAPAVATDGSKIFVFGGSAGASPRTTHTQIYDPAVGEWATGADIPTAVEWSTAAYVNGRIHLLGGVTDATAATNQHWIYNPVTNVWSTGMPLPSAAAGAASGLIDGRVIVVGGIDGPGAYSAHTRVLDVSTDRWSNGADVPVARINWEGAVLGGRLFVAGGSGSGRVTGTALYAYDPATNAWSSLPPIPQANEGYAGTGVRGMYCVLGGRVTPSGGSFNTPFNRVDCYEPGLAVWLSGPPLPVAVEEAGAVSVGGQLYVIGGRVSFAGVTGAVYRLDDPS